MAEATTQRMLPHWNLDQYFPGLGSPEFASAVAEMKREIAFFARRVQEVTSRESSADVAEDADALHKSLIRLMDQVSLIMPYLQCHLAVNSRDELAQRLMSECQIALLPFRQANTRLTAWLGRQDVEAYIASPGSMRTFCGRRRLTPST